MTCSTRAILIAMLLSPAGAMAQISLNDDLDRPILLSAPAQRIVSLSPSITETLFALGAADQVCGVTDQCTYPNAARQKPHVGGMINPSMESIIGLHPDLILLSKEGNTRADFDRLMDLGVTVFVSNPRDLDGILRSIHQIGLLTGHTQTATALIRKLQAREDSIHAQTHDTLTTALLLVSLDPLIAVGRNTFIDDLIRHAGATNIAANATGSYPALSREAVLTVQPDVVVFTGDLAPDTHVLLSHFPEWRQLDAVKKGKLYRIDPDLVSRPGPRAFEGLQHLFHYFHPDNK